METPHPLPWPVLLRYDQAHSRRIALPLGGIGTGTVSLGGRGNLQDWEVVNRPAKGFQPKNAFFSLRTATPDGQVTARALEGAIPFDLYEGWSGSPVPNASGLPIAVLRFVLTNLTGQELQASVAGSLDNFIGQDGSTGASSANRNEVRRSPGAQGLFLSSAGVHPRAEQWGTMALAALSDGPATFRTAWANLSWGNSLLDFWDDFAADGQLEEREAEGVDVPTASVAVSTRIPAGGGAAVAFLLAWHFPNRLSWRAPERNPKTWDDRLRWIGNHYCTQFADAWDVVARVAPQLETLERKTVSFVDAVCRAALPEAVKEAALFNLSTLRSQTCFRTPDGYFFGWEGCQDKFGSCFGSCTHVWNYEQATAFLFGDLARGMREVEFLHATDAQGLMSFRVNLPLEHGTKFGVAAADGQMGCIIKAYRDWQLSGDRAFLERIWPQVRKALEFCWIPNGWDGDRDGVMEGCQHNTMDVEYYGPNPQMGFLYLAALRAGEEMAAYLGDKGFSANCRGLFLNGSRALDANLFNGEYYEHRVVPPSHAPAKGLRWDMGAADLSNPDLQLASGCLVDQLFGQFFAHVCGLGHLADPAKIGTALNNVLKHNFKATLANHFNHMRSYVLNNEAALVMASYPHGNRPTRPFPYFNEVMTGFEYTAAVGLLYEGAVEDGLRCIEAIRARYDGLKRSPFNEAECGHHYARAMASWAAILALTGFHYSAVDETMTFAKTATATEHFWSTGSAWGTLSQRPTGDGIEVNLNVLNGLLRLRRLILSGGGSVERTPGPALQEGEGWQAVLPSR